MTDSSGSGGGASRPSPGSQDPTITVHEEEATVGKTSEGIGSARVRREVETERVRSEEPRRRERLAQERVPVGEGDSGKIETLPDGSISIPLFEEELVVTRKTVLRERVIVRKEEVTEWETVDAELRRERVSFDASDVPPNSVRGADTVAAGHRVSGAVPMSETKPFFLTSEFLFPLLAWLGLLITTLVNDDIDARRFWYLTLALLVGYVLSRGIAKSGTESRSWDPREDPDLLRRREGDG